MPPRRRLQRQAPTPKPVQKQDTVAWIKRLGVKLPQTQARAGWIVCECPLGPWRHEAGKSSSEVFGIKLEAGDSFCNCFACDWHGSQSDLIVTMRQHNKSKPHGIYPFGELLQLIAQAEESAELANLNSPDIEEQLFAPHQGLHVYPEWWLNTFPKWREIEFARQYLAERSVEPDLADLFDIRADTTEKRVCFPVRNFKGELVGLHGRAIIAGVEPRYKMYLQQGRNNPIVWLGEHLVDLEKPLLVVEGPFDMISAMRVYRNVGCPLFSNPNAAKLKRMAGANDIFTFLDRGTGGDKGRDKMAKYMQGSVVTHIHPPKGAKDPGACTLQQLIDVLSPHLKLDLA